MMVAKHNYEMKLEAKFANLSTWCTKTTRFATNVPQALESLASFCCSSFTIVLAFLADAVILTVTLFTRTCTSRAHSRIKFAIVFNNDSLAKLGIEVFTISTS